MLFTRKKAEELQKIDQEESWKAGFSGRVNIGLVAILVLLPDFLQEVIFEEIFTITLFSSVAPTRNLP